MYAIRSYYEDRPILYLLRHFPHIVIVNLHVESPGSPGDYLSDPPEPENPEPFARHLGAHHEAGAPVLPRAGADQPFALACPPRRAQHQHHGQFRRGVGQYLGRVRDDDSPCLCGLYVHVVVSDGKIRNGADAVGQPGDHFRTELFRITSYNVCYTKLLR